MTTLEYQPPQPTRRKVLRRVGAACVILLVGLILLKIVPPAWQQIQVLYWQSRCMNYQAGPEQEVATFAISSVPEEWEKLSSLLYPPGMQTHGTLFLHERISPSGNRRLVAVDTNVTVMPPKEGREKLNVITAVKVFRPGSGYAPPREVNQPTGRAADYFIGNVFYAGQADPNDPSHFTIRLQTLKGDRIIDGWLTDSDQVLLELRTPSSKPTTQQN